MKLLEAQPEIAPGTPPAPPVATPPEDPAADPGARTCKSCGATMAPGQDWCLSCGTAAGRIGSRPGVRPAMTVFGLTALLVAGAVGASYAALRENQTVPPSQAAAAQVAQAPPAATTAPPATTPPASTSTTPTTGTTTGKSSIPKVSVPSTASPAPVPATPSTPPATPSSPTPSVSPTPAPTPSASPPSGSSGGGGSQTSAGGSQTSTGGQTTTPAPAAPVAIDLGASAASVYDPYSRATAVGAPAKAIDGDASTSWFVDTAPGQTTVGAGLVVSLGSLRGTKAIDITTPTPGFKVEIYETDETTPPPAITDTRWAHITDKENVGEGGKTHIVLGGGSSKYATLLVWITKPPSDGTRVRIAELKVFG